jgi:hypothetical protein
VTRRELRTPWCVSLGKERQNVHGSSLANSKDRSCGFDLAHSLSAGRAIPAHTPTQNLDWTNARSFGLSVEYPAGIFATDAGPAERGPGRKFISTDRTAGFEFYVEQNPEHYTPRSFVRSRLKFPPSEIDYRRVTDRFVVISGIHEGHIYYSRCNFPMGSSGPLHCIHLAYNKDEKEDWDGIVTRVSLSLQ